MCLTNENLASRVRTGAKVLDIIRPDWFKEIHIYSLDMGNTLYCILGQLDEKRLSDEDVNLGFYVCFKEKKSLPENGDGWKDTLRGYWVEEINKRIAV